MTATFPTELLLRFLQATPEVLAAIEPLLPPLPDVEQGAAGAPGAAVPAAGALPPGAPAGSVCAFRRVGKRWEVVLDGGTAFRLKNTLGARCLNYLLHEPNEPIHAFHLEVKVQPEKGDIRARDSIQPDSDPKALRQYRAELERLKAERAKAQAVGHREKVAGLNGQIAALELVLKPGGGAADTGERARNNVRKAIAVVMKQLEEGSVEQRAFAEHLRTHLNVGYECLYSHSQGRIWG